MFRALTCRVILPRFKAVRAVAIALVLPHAASAQTFDHRVVAGAGMDAALFDGSQYVPAYVGQVGLEIRKPGSRSAFRMSLMHYNQDRTDPYAPCDEWRRCTLSTGYSVTGMKVDATFDLTCGRVRPYLLAGAGVYRSKTVTSGHYTCVSLCTQPMFAWQSPTESVAASAGFDPGIGVAGKLGKTPVFAEMRMLLLATDGMRGRGMLPVTFGVKF